MNFKIHRGTKEIGGSCVEVWTENSRILVDFGMPLVDSDGKDFDFNKYINLTSDELVALGVLPDIEGLYNGKGNMIDGVIISHAHQDHYGFINHIDKKVRFYSGKASHEIIGINNLIYSMWEGYLQKPHTKQFIDSLTSRGFTMQNIHTSGHADTQTLKLMVEAMKPQTIVPIHTFGAGLYKSIFSSPVIELNDGEVMSL
ncbi:MAG: MBL fold metallo-hydrolase [Bacteroidia bacterium]|nr:MAG: MBL fold metallo-hydrolase [Bacteroidia bacterium]